MNNYVIGIVVVLILIVGGFFLLQDGTEPVMEGTPGDNTATEETDTTTTPPPPPPPSGIDAVAPPPAPATSAPVTVTYSDSGFSPSTVTIKRGQTVEFKNESSRDFWPASAVHPTHTVYPEKSSSDCFGSSFDACGKIATGSSWSFTFNSVGEWRYHDHVSANRTGTVVVTN